MEKKKELDEMKTIFGNEATDKYVENMRTIFDSICDKTYWKNPFETNVDVLFLGVVIECIDWFLADFPDVIRNKDGSYQVRSHGYQAD